MSLNEKAKIQAEGVQFLWIQFVVGQPVAPNDALHVRLPATGVQQLPKAAVLKLARMKTK